MIKNIACSILFSLRVSRSGLIQTILAFGLLLAPELANPRFVHGTDVTIENVAFIAPRESGEPMRAVFDVSWKNAWRSARNHDAAWIFLKLRRENGSFTHVRLAAAGHSVVSTQVSGAPTATIEPSPDGVGAMIYSSQPYGGDVAWRISLMLDQERAEEDYPSGRLSVYGIEMVHVPEGPFYAGDVDPKAYEFGAFYRSSASGEPDGLFSVASESEIPVGQEAGAISYRPGEYEGDANGPIPAPFPKGFAAFYVMKYELTQGQYAAFLNTLSDAATYDRTNFGGRNYYENRGTIRLEDGRYVAASPGRPMNFLSWDDGLAYVDWAGLRPMTELEFAKAARGPDRPGPSAFPWGTSSRDQIARIVDPNDELSIAGGRSEAELTDATRPVFGASYYWVMDLAGSVWERVISIGSPDGRAFQGSHGDGVLGSHGRATNEDWPHTYTGGAGHGYRGGGFYNQGQSVHEFNPYSPVSYRRFGAWAGEYPSVAYGFRGARGGW